MRKPDLKVLKSLCNLEKNPDFRVVMEWIIESSNDLDKTLRSSESQVALFRAQGGQAELLALSEYSSKPCELAGKVAMKKAGVVIDS